jgi:hypothetical protein
MREIRSACLSGKKDWLKNWRPIGSGVFVCAVIGKDGSHRAVTLDLPVEVRFVTAGATHGVAKFPDGKVHTLKRKALAVLFKSDEIAQPEPLDTVAGPYEPFVFAKEVATRVKEMRAEEDTENEPVMVRAITAQPLAVTVAEAAKLCAMSRSTIYRAIKEKLLVPRKYGLRTIILVDELNEFLKDLPISR